MKKTIGIIAVLMLFCLTLVSADTQVSVDVSSTESIDGYFNLNSPDNDIYINGVNYKGYVDYKVEQVDSAKSDVVKMFDKVTLFMVNPKGYLSSDIIV